MSDETYLKLRFCDACPEIMGVDMERYGPFEKGDETEMPEDNAEVLLDQGIAELLESE
ncbi:MAG TPA: hypothetical protein VFJ06_09755 [Halococcus sp.]|nr:hypothetical protein [Halococcus sp.]